MTTTESRMSHDGTRKKEEFRSFIFLTAVMVPALSVIIVAGYGFIVWIVQMINGPPTH